MTTSGKASSSWRDWTPPAGSKSTHPGDLPVPVTKPRVNPSNKFHAEKTVARDGTVLDSAHEARVYQDLLFRERAGEIRDLQRQVPMPLVVNGEHITTLRVDFVYLDVQTGQTVYLEAKSKVTRTRFYVASRKLFKALVGVPVVEV